jgi:hypothetical protein
VLGKADEMITEFVSLAFTALEGQVKEVTASSPSPGELILLCCYACALLASI